MRQISGGRLGAVGLLAIGIMLAPATAGAQSVPNDRIDLIERQIRALQGQLEQLKGELGAARQEVRQSREDARQARAQLQQAREAASRARQDALSAATAESGAAQAAARAQAIASAPPLPPPPAAPAPHVVQTAGNRFGLESPDGRNSIFLTGRLHFDVGDYLDYQPQSRTFAAVQNLNSGVNARRARLGVTGKFDGDWNYTFIYDAGGSTDATLGALGSGIEVAASLDPGGRQQHLRQ
jgi:phosphate-selective porin OprO/OprP